MRSCLILIFFLVQNPIAMGQTFPIGHRTITYNDPARSGGFGSGGGAGRQIQTEIYYPGVSAGDNVSPAFGSFPVIVFGHGFQMTWDVYSPIYDSLARKGYIVCTPRTEGGILPTHTEFAKDLALVLDKTLAFNSDVNSPFYGKINGKGAIGGHSMGGGCSFLSAQYTSNETAIFNFAAAETNPSAIAQCSTSVSAPLLVIAGSYDVVAPPASNQDAMYNAALSSCKTYFNITGGYHCQFSNVSTQCQFGEGTLFPPSGGPSRNTQLQLTRDILMPFLDFWLKGNCSQWANLMSIYSNSTAYTKQQSCNVDIPSSATISPEGPVAICQGSATTLAVNAGNYQTLWSNNQTTPTIGVSNPGNYTVTLTGSNNCSVTSSPVSITISQPDATITANGPINFCEGDSVTLSVANAATYAWSDGSSASNLVVNQSGSYSVSVTDLNGCVTNSTPVQIIVLDSLQPVISTPDGTEICGNFPIPLQLVDSLNYTEIQWSNAAVSSTIYVNQSNEYCVYVNNGSGCGGSACINVIQNPLPDAGFILNANSPINIGQTIQFTATTTNLNSLYSWDFGDGNNSTDTTAFHSYPFPGTYTICLDVSSQVSSCTAQSCQTIIVGPFVGQNEVSEPEIKVYPNPLIKHQKLTIQSKHKTTLRVFDSFGRKVHESDFPAGEKQLESNDYPAGVYFIELDQTFFKVILTENQTH